LENETDEVVSGVSTLSMAVERTGPLSFADICDLGAEVAATLADQHDDGAAHGHVAVGSVVRLDDGPWRLAPSELVPDVEPVLAPELQGGADRTPAGDVYALGAVLSYGLTGIAVDPAAADTAGSAPTDEPTTGPADEPVVDGPALDGPAVAAPAGRIGVDPDGEPTLELSADDLDRLRNFGEAPEEPASTDDVPIDLTDELDDADDAPMTLPEVMSSFLGVLRSSLAVDPADRPTASSLAATLRQLRSDADSALGGALVGGVAAVAIGDAAGAEPWGAPLYDTADVEPGLANGSVAAPPPPVGPLTVEGTGSAATLGAAGAKAKTKKSFKERAPLLVAAAAVVVALLLGLSLVRERNDKSADLLAVGPTVGTTVRRSTTTTIPALPADLIVETTTTLASSTTSTTSTTKPPDQQVVVETTVPTTAPTTTEPPTTLPSTTLPATTTTARPQTDVQATVVCGTVTIPCPVKLYSEPSTAPPSVEKGAVPNGTTLTAQCAKDGELIGGSKVWLRVASGQTLVWIPQAAVTTQRPPIPCTS
jgi:hypothetical protein